MQGWEVGESGNPEKYMDLVFEGGGVKGIALVGPFLRPRGAELRAPEHGRSLDRREDHGGAIRSSVVRSSQDRAMELFEPLRREVQSTGARPEPN